ncbi:MAG: type II toxin-antitoxin system RelE/ParE family toxin [Planctomycetota bacterium]
MEIEFTPDATDGYDSLPTRMQDRVDALIARLEKWPEVSGAKPLRHKLKGHFRLRTGKYRVVFHLQGEVLVIDRIDDRKDVY